MSHHYSGPQLGFPRDDARLDFCDLYAFPKPGDSKKSILIMNFHPSSTVSVDLSPEAKPLELTTGVPFSPDALYELKIDTNGDSIADVTYQVTCSPFAAGQQTATLRLIKEANGASASGSEQILFENVPVSLDANANVVESEDHRFFAGWRSDPFFFDPPGAFNGFQFIGAKDFFGDKDVCSIVLEVPNTVFGQGKVNIWARSMVNTDGAWVQVDRGAIESPRVF